MPALAINPHQTIRRVDPAPTGLDIKSAPHQIPLPQAEGVGVMSKQRQNEFYVLNKGNVIAGWRDRYDS